MALLSKYYDYELKREAYKLTGEKGYARSTSTLLEFVSVTNTTMDYCTATYKVNVISDRGDSQIVFYDNGVLIPFYINNTEYTYLEWSNQTTNPITISFQLTYETTHNIQAKYLGNNRCVSSKSKALDLFQEKPPTATTNIALAFNKTNKIYASSDTVTCTATLSIVDTSLNPTANRSQTINFYVDGVLNGSATTNNSGVATYNLSNVSVGQHIVTAKYEGSQYLFHTETSDTISKGYQLEITSHSSYAINHDNITATVHLSDYFDNPIASETVALADNTHTSLNITGTTNSSGNVTLTLPYSKYSSLGTTINNVRTFDFSARYSATEYSSNVTSKDIYNVTIDIGTPITAVKNQTITISGTVLNANNNAIDVSYTGAMNGSVTSKNGHISVVYTGDGGGSKNVTFAVNGNSLTVRIDDLLSYGVANNFFYNEPKCTSGEFRKLSNGFKLSNSAGGFGRLNFGSLSVDSELTFLVRGQGGALYFGALSGENGGALVNKTFQAPVGVTIKNEEGQIKIYEETTLLQSYSSEYGDFEIFIYSEADNYLIFDNVKWKVL